MTARILIVPGYHGSGEGHWQTWLEGELRFCRCVSGIDWERPQLHIWAQEIRREILASHEPLIIVAHSFGCLATAVAVEGLSDKVAGVILVAPADPDRFAISGPRQGDAANLPSIAQYLPAKPLNTAGLLIASQNDPWMKYQHAYAWAKRWNVEFFNAGYVGHINIESGHGEWPLIVKLVNAMRDATEQTQVVNLQRKRLLAVDAPRQLLYA